MNFSILTTGAVLLSLGTSAIAESIAAGRTVRARTVLTADDLMVIDSDGAFNAAEQVVGLETRVALYKGRPITVADVGPAAIIGRNQIIKLVFQNQYLSIVTDGRSLARGGIGDSIRVMNLGSKSTVVGVVSANGSVIVGNGADLSASR